MSVTPHPAPPAVYFALATPETPAKVTAIFRAANPDGSRSSIIRPSSYWEPDRDGLLEALLRAQAETGDTVLREVPFSDMRAIEDGWSSAEAASHSPHARRHGALADTPYPGASPAVSAALDADVAPSRAHLAQLVATETYLRGANAALVEELDMAEAHQPEVAAAIAVNLSDDSDWDAVARWCGGTVSNTEGPDGETVSHVSIPGAGDAWNGSWIVQDLTGTFSVCTGIDGPTPGMLMRGFLSDAVTGDADTWRVKLADRIPLSLLDGRDRRSNAFQVADEIIADGWLAPSAAHRIVTDWVEAIEARDANAARVIELEQRLRALGDTETRN